MKRAGKDKPTLETYESIVSYTFAFTSMVVIYEICKGQSLSEN